MLLPVRPRLLGHGQEGRHIGLRLVGIRGQLLEQRNTCRVLDHTRQCERAPIEVTRTMQAVHKRGRSSAVSGGEVRSSRVHASSSALVSLGA